MNVTPENCARDSFHIKILFETHDVVSEYIWHILIDVYDTH